MRRRTTILFVIIATLVAVLFVVDIIVGEISIPLRRVVEVVFGTVDDDTLRAILLDIRLVKALMALLSGAALSVAGLQMQTLFRNPLAGPYVLGVSAGASLGVALFLLGAPLLGVATYPLLQTVGVTGAAWLGSAAVLFVVVALSRRIKDIMVILILGMMLSSAIGAVVEILQYLSSEAALKSFVIWTMGSLGDVTMRQTAIIVPIIVVGLTLGLAGVKAMNMLLLGETYARTMGLNITATRRVLFCSTILLAGTITAFCGPIGFVGLAVPHVARMVFRTADHRILLPASILIGQIMMLLCDMLSKWLTLPINSLTALMGIPIVILIVVRNREITR